MTTQTSNDSQDNLKRLLIEFDYRGKLSDEEHLEAFQKIENFVTSLITQARIDEINRVPERGWTTGAGTWHRASRLNELSTGIDLQLDKPLANTDAANAQSKALQDSGRETHE